MASRVLLDDTGAEDLPSIAGRAIYQIEKQRTIQVPYISDKQMLKMLGEMSDVINNTAASGKPTTDNRQAGNGEDKTPTANP